jgi:hypothetical protein
VKLTSSYTRVKSGYMPLGVDTGDPAVVLMFKDLNNIVHNVIHLGATVTGQDDLAKKIETLPPEDQKKYAGYWKRVKQAIDRFVEGGDVPPSTEPE